MVSIEKVENGYLIKMLAYGNASEWVCENPVTPERLGSIIIEVMHEVEQLRVKSEERKK